MKADTVRAALLASWCAVVAGHAFDAAAAPRARPARSALEFTPQGVNALDSLEVEIAGTSAPQPRRLPVSDAALFVSKSGGGAESALAAANSIQPSPTTGFFSVRIFVVAGGRLYTGGRGQCGAWESDVSRCSASCEGGAFALRRNGSAALEVLLGAIPGGEAGAGPGLTISACGFDDDGGDVRLVAKGGRGLAVAPFGRD